MIGSRAWLSLGLVVLFVLIGGVFARDRTGLNVAARQSTRSSGPVTQGAGDGLGTPTAALSTVQIG